MSATVPVETIGAPILAADYNFLVGGTANQRPSFQAVQNATQSIANNTNAAVLFQNVIRDTDSAYVAGTGLYTVATAGIWLFVANLVWASNATGLRALTLSVGSQQSVNEIPTSTDTQGRATASCLAVLTAGQTAQCFGFQTSTISLNTAGNSAVSFSGFWLGS